MIALILVKPACGLLARGGLRAKNFRHVFIPTGVGIVLPLASLVPIGIFGSPPQSSLWLFILFGVAMLGLVDDVAGKGEHGGFTSHLRALRRGTLTTGSVKALFGGGVALYAGWMLHGSALPAALAGGVIALSTNAVNLLDLRPGRAIKGAMLLSVAGLIALTFAGSPVAEAWQSALLAAAPLGAGVALLWGDLRARFMIGDTGANTLGISAGMILALLPYFLQGVALLVLVLIHAISERRSLSSLIETTPILKWLDDLGRG